MRTFLIWGDGSVPDPQYEQYSASILNELIPRSVAKTFLNQIYTYTLIIRTVSSFLFVRGFN